MLQPLIRRLFGLAGSRRLLRTAMLALVYSVLAGGSLWAAYLLRFDFAVPSWVARNIVGVCCIAVAAKLVCLALFRQFDGFLTYFSIPDLRRLVMACSCGSIFLACARVIEDVPFAPPRGVILTDFVLCLGALCGARLSLRHMRIVGCNEMGARSRRKRVAIVGAGETGAMLARELFADPGLGLEPVVFLDDSHRTRCSLHGLPVIGPLENVLCVKDSFRIQEVIIAAPSMSAKRIRELVVLIRQAGLSCRTVPSLYQIATGQVNITSLRPIQIEDLLRRAPIPSESRTTRQSLRGKTVMVTGAGGSIGSELCRQVLAHEPQRLLLVERSEPNLFLIEQELSALERSSAIVPVVADVTRQERMREVLSRYRPHVIYHAAAHKHVPMMESQPEEAIRNNIFGTALLADLAAEYSIERFVLVSTDKAVNPTSVMGATKRFAELYMQSLVANSPSTKFMAVRFGNVLGSSGSVVPIFTKQIAGGGPVTVTAPEVTRFFMTIPEAVTLVLQSSTMGSGGDIFVLDMGNSVRIVDLATQMIILSGLKPHTDIEIVFTGLRPGEKLYEEVSHRREDVTPTEHPKILRLHSEPRPHAEMLQALHRLGNAIIDPDLNPADLKRLLVETIPEYTPFGAAAPVSSQGSGAQPFLDGVTSSGLLPSTR